MLGQGKRKRVIDVAEVASEGEIASLMERGAPPICRGTGHATRVRGTGHATWGRGTGHTT